MALSARISRLYSTSKLVAVEVNKKSGIATVTLQKSPVNSLDLQLLTELCETFTHLESSKPRGVILTSSLNNIFSAGLDFTELVRPDPYRFKLFWTSLQQCWMKLYGSSYPTVAVINGHSPAGGCLLALACEYRIMLKGFTIGLNESRLSLPVPPWLSIAMCNTVKLRQAELALTSGKLFETVEASQIGLVDEITSTKEEAIIKSQKFLDKFDNIPRTARVLTKQSLRGKEIQNLSGSLKEDLERMLSLVRQETTQETLGKYWKSLKQRQT